MGTSPTIVGSKTEEDLPRSRTCNLTSCPSLIGMVPTTRTPPLPDDDVKFRWVNSTQSPSAAGMGRAVEGEVQTRPEKKIPLVRIYEKTDTILKKKIKEHVRPTFD